MHDKCLTVGNSAAANCVSVVFATIAEGDSICTDKEQPLPTTLPFTIAAMSFPFWMMKPSRVRLGRPGKAVGNYPIVRLAGTPSRTTNWNSYFMPRNARCRESAPKGDRLDRL